MTSVPEWPPCGACSAPARHVCSRCRQERYCSAKCQAADWGRHKASCGKNKVSTKKSEIVAPDTPSKEKEDVCANCQGAAKTKCSNCRKVFYCKRACQKDHWNSHKSNCNPFEVVENEQLGRYMRATRDLKAGDVILKEEPLLLGLFEAKELACVVCYRTVEESVRCEACGWPCCVPCRDSKTHAAECALSRPAREAVRGLGAGELGAVLPLRVFALQNNKENFKKFMSLRFHENEREKNNKKIELQGKFTKSLQMILKTNPTQKPDRMSIGEIVKHTLARIDENAFDVESVVSQEPIKGLYPIAAMMEHSCRPNTKLRFTNSNSMVVKAAVDIKEGSNISNSYTKLLQGTKARRQLLEEERYFLCGCERCSDPSEFGTNFSALKCKDCSEGYYLPEDSLEMNSNWVCKLCGKGISCQEADYIASSLGDEVSLAMKSPDKEKLEDILKRHVGITVHANHFHLMLARHTLLQLYGQCPTAHKEDTLAKKEALCKDLISLFSRLDPGGSRAGPYAGVVFFEYHTLLMLRMQRMSGARYPNEAGIDQCVSLAKAFLKQCVSVLRDEPEASPEGRLKTMAQKKLTDIGLLTAKSPEKASK